MTSLLNVWDVGGQTRQEVFVNTPCAPRVHRSGSRKAKTASKLLATGTGLQRTPTLRSLLGEEDKPNRNLQLPSGDRSPDQEGDISWAERFLKSV